MNANWSHEFRKMFGYHDTLDFPNKLESWSDLLHPQDKERVMVQLQAAIKDKTNQIKYQVEYRMRMKDNQYQWFRASAEVIRRLDGSASRIAGIFINIDAEKKEIMQAQKSAAFHRAFTKADLCEYYVNLEANTFDTFKVEPSLMTVFEQSHTWDELIRHFVDSYVVETDKKLVSAFYNRDYIAERLKGLETELALECRITLNGEEQWVRNVVIRGEIEDSEYAMIFLRDITEAKAESARHLQMTGAEVETAENGKIAVEKVEASPKDLYDLVFMDIQMPVMNGYEATAAIRSLPGEQGKLPIVAMTANAFAEDVQLAKNTGMNGHIAKPLDMNKLNDVLESWL